MGGKTDVVQQREFLKKTNKQYAPAGASQRQIFAKFPMYPKTLEHISMLKRANSNALAELKKELYMKVKPPHYSRQELNHQEFLSHELGTLNARPKVPKTLPKVRRNSLDPNFCELLDKVQQASLLSPSECFTQAKSLGVTRADTLLSRSNLHQLLKDNTELNLYWCKALKQKRRVK